MRSVKRICSFGTACRAERFFDNGRSGLLRTLNNMAKAT